MSPWQPSLDPDHHRDISNPNLSTTEQHNLQVLYDTKKLVFGAKVSVQIALINALNLAIPDKYKQMDGNQIGTHQYRSSDNPQQILQYLSNLYGKPTPEEKKANKCN